MPAVNEIRPERSGNGSPWILGWLDRVSAGARVLDFASGAGRHARAAAWRGFSVLAVDRNADALARCRSLWTSGEGLPAAAADDTHSRASKGPEGPERPATIPAQQAIATRVADLEHGPWPFAAEERFGAVIVANYLFRPRFALLAALVAPGGFLIYETFARGNEIFGRPSNPAYLLEEGELLVRARHAGLSILDYQTGIAPGAPPALIQRLCAIRATGAGARIALS